VSYANVVKGAPPFPTPPPPARPQQQPPPPPQPQPPPCSADDLERRQAYESLFSLYESQHLQMMSIKDLIVNRSQPPGGWAPRPPGDAPRPARGAQRPRGGQQRPAGARQRLQGDLRRPLKSPFKRFREEGNFFFAEEGFRCGSDRTGLFLAAGGEKKPDGNSMKLLTWNACRLLAGAGSSP
jgi:hypothetical protein